MNVGLQLLILFLQDFCKGHVKPSGFRPPLTLHIKRIKCLPSTPRRTNLKTQQPPDRAFCVWGKLVQGNHNAFVFKIFSFHTKMKSRRLQIPPLSRAFWKKLRFQIPRAWCERGFRLERMGCDPQFGRHIYSPILSSFELSPVSCSSNTTLVSYNNSFCSFNSCKQQTDLSVQTDILHFHLCNYIFVTK